MEKYSNETIKGLEDKAYELRHLTLDMCIRANTGHVTSSMSCAEIMAGLYNGGILKKDSENPEWDGRDRFILSKGQASPILYATLADNGYFPKSWLRTFNAKGGKFGVHLQGDVPGVEYTTGSLGHGLGLGTGVALAAKKDQKKHKTFVLLGDAELQEGSNWESAMLASTLRLNNLIGIVDRNGYGVLCPTEEDAGLNPLDDKFRSFGWDVKCIDGHNMGEVMNSLDEVSYRKGTSPYMIIADTTKGKGVASWENVALRHGTAPMGEEAERLKQELTSQCRGDCGDKCEIYNTENLDKWSCNKHGR